MDGRNREAQSAPALPYEVPKEEVEVEEEEEEEEETRDEQWQNSTFVFIWLLRGCTTTGYCQCARVARIVLHYNTTIGFSSFIPM